MAEAENEELAQKMMTCRQWHMIPDLSPALLLRHAWTLCQWSKISEQLILIQQSHGR